jgi:uncharacterized membrane protein YqjE
MNSFSLQPAGGIALIVGAPLVLAVVELFHPHPADLLNVNVETWLAVHYAQILLFPLSALSVTALVNHQRCVATTICRVAMFIFAVSFVAFDTAAGVVTGILVDAAQKSRSPETWRAAIDAVWTDPVMGGSPLVAAPFLAVLGSIALSVGGVAGAVALKRGGSSWGPISLLAISSFGISIFKTHAWPGGPLTFSGMAIAAAWILWERNAPRKDTESATSTQ